MRRHRFIGDFNFDSDQVNIGDLDMVHQWRRVLRLVSGDEVILVDQKRQQEAICKILSFSEMGAIVQVLSIKKLETENTAHINLYCAVLKKENFEWVVQKATECGVTKIIPIITDRTVKQNIKFDRLIKIATEASEQSGRGQVPVIEGCQKFSDISLAGDDHSVYFFEANLESKPVAFDSVAKDINIFIGPEGGWSEKEIEYAKLKKWQIVSLGKRVLRAETAAIVTTYLAGQNC